MRRAFCVALLFLGTLLGSGKVLAHGGVALVDDVCVMSLGNLSAHFASFQPRTQKSKEFCEDIPDVSDSIFVIDFIHDVLGSMPVDFRIVRDVNNVGLSASWDDVQAIEDLQSATVFYQPPKLYGDNSINVRHQFSEKGGYIGVVTAHDATRNKTHRAVFPFRVGARDFWDYLPYFIGLLFFLEAFYWVSSGGLERRRNADGATSTRIQNLTTSAIH